MLWWSGTKIQKHLKLGKAGKGHEFGSEVPRKILQRRNDLYDGRPSRNEVIEELMSIKYLDRT